jgi:hypothetical protein
MTFKFQKVADLTLLVGDSVIRPELGLYDNNDCNIYRALRIYDPVHKGAWYVCRERWGLAELVVWKGDDTHTAQALFHQVIEPALKYLRGMQ